MLHLKKNESVSQDETILYLSNIFFCWIGSLRADTIIVVVHSPSGFKTKSNFNFHFDNIE